MADQKINLGIHNVVKIVPERDVGMHRNTHARVDPFMATLIQELSRKRPTWEFRAKDFSTQRGDLYYHARFALIDMGEEIGWIAKYINYRTGENSYEFDGHRLVKARRRNVATRTKDLKKAVRTITDNLYALTVEERALKARQEAHGVAGKHYSKHYYEFRTKRDHLMDAMVAFTFAHWDAFTGSRLINTPLERSAADILHEKHEVYMGVNTIYNARETKTGATVFQWGETYYVFHDEASSHEVRGFTLDALPDRIKSAVALLKLLEPDHYVAGVGSRVDSTTFYVVEGAKDELQQLPTP
jgi:hypothetical protein